MNINFKGRRAQTEQRDDQFDVYEADAERLYDSFSDLYDDFDEGRSKAPFVIVGALLAVAIVGGGLAFAYKRGGGEGTDGPTVILAERTPTKVEPDEPGGIEIPHQDRQIFEEVAGQSGDGQSTGEGTGASQSLTIPSPVRQPPKPVASGISVVPATPDTTAGTQSGQGELTIGTLATRVTSGESGPLIRPAEVQAIVPDVPAATPGAVPAPISPDEIARLANPDSAGQAIPESLPLIGQGLPSTGVFQPRRVPTVSIGPDGSVITEAAPQPAAPVAATPEPATPAPAAPTPVTTAARALPAPPGAIPVVVAPQGEQAAHGLRLPPGSAVESVLRAAPEAVDPASQTSLFAPSPRPKPRPTTRVAVNNPQAGAVPTATRPTIPAPARNAAASSALQGFAVQVASHRRQSEAVAAFADLQRHYPNLITGYQPLIQRADLGDRGIYYRLRIGPVATKSDANSLCTSLKSAGLRGCLVRPL